MKQSGDLVREDHTLRDGISKRGLWRSMQGASGFPQDRLGAVWSGILVPGPGPSAEGSLMGDGAPLRSAERQGHGLEQGHCAQYAPGSSGTRILQALGLFVPKPK